jgi:hypothetical protein
MIMLDILKKLFRRRSSMSAEERLAKDLGLEYVDLRSAEDRLEQSLDDSHGEHQKNNNP